MTFWDTSTLVPLLVREPSTEQARGWLEADPEVVVWWGTEVECAAAIARLRRQGALDVRGEADLLSLLDTLRRSWTEVLPSDALRTLARRLLRVHPLRASDALQLAAALTWAGIPGGHTLRTFDERLALAASLEGFTVVGRGEGERPLDADRG